MTVRKCASYREFLKKVLLEKKERNSAYSMRAFAQALGTSQTAVSEMIAGKRKLSPASLSNLVEKLHLSEEEAEYLCLLTQLEVATSPILRNALSRRLAQLASPS